MGNLNLRGQQLTIQRMLEKGDIPYEVWRRWKQPAIRGMFFRGLFRLTAKFAMSKTAEGMRALASYRIASPDVRKNQTAPIKWRDSVAKPKRTQKARGRKKKIHLVA